LCAQAQVFDPPTPQPNAAVQQAGGAAVQQAEGVEQTGWGIPMPKITMPKLTMPQVEMPSMAAITAPVKSGFEKVTTGTKKAWEGTKEMFTLGQNTSSGSRGRAQQPSLWQRLTTKPEPQGPQTVGEFMRQPRLDP